MGHMIVTFGRTCVSNSDLCIAAKECDIRIYVANEFILIQKKRDAVRKFAKDGNDMINEVTFVKELLEFMPESFEAAKNSRFNKMRTSDEVWKALVDKLKKIPKKLET